MERLARRPLRSENALPPPDGNATLGHKPCRCRQIRSLLAVCAARPVSVTLPVRRAAKERSLQLSRFFLTVLLLRNYNSVSGLNVERAVNGCFHFASTQYGDFPRADRPVVTDAGGPHHSLSLRRYRSIES